MYHTSNLYSKPVKYTTLLKQTPQKRDIRILFSTFHPECNDISLALFEYQIQPLILLPRTFKQKSLVTAIVRTYQIFFLYSVTGKRAHPKIRSVCVTVRDARRPIFVSQSRMICLQRLRYKGMSQDWHLVRFVWFVSSSDTGDLVWGRLSGWKRTLLQVGLELKRLLPLLSLTTTNKLFMLRWPFE